MPSIDYSLISWNPTLLQVVSLGVLSVLAAVIAWDRSSKRVAGIAWACGLAGLLSLVHQLAFDSLAEDAFITFRYARNLAAGNGCVFNIGDRVEGYSNFLWLVTLASTHAAFSIDIVLAARVMGVSFSIGNLALCFFIAQKLAPREPAVGLVPVLFLSSSSLFAAWGLSGMEHPMYTFWLLLSVYFALSSRWAALGLSLALLSMTRFEGVIFFVPVAAWVCVYAPRTSRFGVLRLITLIFLAIYLPYTIWRLSYFGELLPNTVVAKSGAHLLYRFGKGIDYVVAGAASNIGLLLAFVVPWVLMAFGIRGNSAVKASVFRSRPTPGEGLLVLIAATYLAFIVFIGGDWMPAWRFLYVLTPIAALLTALAWKRCAWMELSGWRRVLLVMSLGLACLHSLNESFVHPNLIPRIRLWKSRNVGLAEFGEFLRDSVPETTRIAVQANGALSYHSRLPTIDMLGLTDSYIARSGLRADSGMAGHSAYDYAYVASLQPQLVHFGGQAFKPTPGRRMRAEFEAQYVARSLHFDNVTNPEGSYVDLLLLRSESARLLELLSRDPNVSVVDWKTLRWNGQLGRRGHRPR